MDSDEEDTVAEDIAADLLKEIYVDTWINYEAPYQPVDAKELVHLGWNQLSRDLPQRKVAVHRDFWHAAGAVKASDPRTARRCLEERTGIRIVRYECCPASHVCYEDTRYKNLDACPKEDCGLPRWRDKKKDKNGNEIRVATAYFHTIKLEPRLRLWMSNKGRAETMKSYRRYAENSSLYTNSRNVSFFGGKLFQKLKRRGLFDNDADLALFLTTDAMKVFKSRKEYKCQPIATVGDPRSRTQRRRARRSPS